MNKKASPEAVEASPCAGEVMFAFIDAGHALEKRIEDALDEAGLSWPKFGVLTHLVQAGEPLSLSECAAKMTCVRSNITQLMDRLETDGLVRRVEDPSDRRAVRAAVTPLGRERQAAGALKMQTLHAEFARTLAAVDQGALRQTLAAIR